MRVLGKVRTVLVGRSAKEKKNTGTDGREYQKRRGGERREMGTWAER